MPPTNEKGSCVPIQMIECTARWPGMNRASAEIQLQVALSLHFFNYRLLERSAVGSSR